MTETRRVGTMKTVGGRYSDGSRSYQRVSNLLENLKTDTFHLDEWKANTLVVGLSQRADLILGIAAATQYDPETGKLTKDAKEALQGLRKQAMEVGRSKAGATRGTAVHTATERLDLGETVEQIGLPAPYGADLYAYEVLKGALGLTFDPRHVERSVRNQVTDNVGTFDRLGSCKALVELGFVPDGELVVVDVKTEESPLYNLIHIAPQLATYANATEMFIPEPTRENEHCGRWEPMPAVSKEVGLLIHVRDGRATPYALDLVAGWEAAQAAAAHRERVKASKIKLGVTGCWAVPVPVKLPPATELTADAIARGPLGFSAPAGEVRPGDLDDTDRQAIENVWGARELSDLAETYRIYTEVCGREWGGRVAEAGAARQRQIECPNRAMHTSGKCACGWTPAVPA